MKIFRHIYPWFFDVLVLFALSLIPVLWFGNNFVITGHDAGYPINITETFKNRLFTWNNQDNLGYENTVNIGAISLHFLEVMFHVLGQSPTHAQQSVFVFWFFCMGLSMYWFAYTLKSHIQFRFFPLVAAVVYIINFYLLALWRYGAGTTFSAYTALPLLTGLVIMALEKRQRWGMFGLWIGTVAAIFNGGGGFSLPLFGGVLVTITCALVYFICIERSGSFIVVLRGGATTVVVAGITYAALSAYWLIPFVYYVITNFVRDMAVHGGATGVLAWADAVSKSTSIANLMRLQGFPDWYESTKHAYAATFLHHPLFIIASFLFPIGSYAAVFLTKTFKEKKIVLYGIITSLIALFFTAGTHPPTGWLFGQMMIHIPGFAIFRSAQYKFIPALYFAFAILFSFTINALLERYVKRPLIKAVWVLIVCVGILGYHFPFMQTDFFAWNDPFTTRIQVPQHVLLYDAWIKEHLDKDDRVLILPPLNKEWKSEAYQWNFFSLYSLFNLLYPQPFVEFSQTMEGSKVALIDRLAQDIKYQGPLVEPIRQALGISYGLVRSDTYTDQYWLPSETATDYTRALEKDGKVVAWQNGPWQLFALGAQKDVKRLYALNAVDVFVGDEQHMVLPIVGGSSQVLYYPLYNQQHIDAISVPVRQLILEANCETCAFFEPIPELSYSIPRVLPGSLFYFLKELRDKNKWRGTLQDESGIATYLSHTLQKSTEVQGLWGQPRNTYLLVEIAEILRTQWQEIEGYVVSNDTKGLSVNLTRLLEQYARAQLRILSDFTTDPAYGETAALLTQTTQSINTVLALAAKQKDGWMSQKKYSVPRGFYKGEIFLDINSLEQNVDGSHNLPTQILLNGTLLPTRPTVIGAKVSLGEIEAKEGDTVILMFGQQRQRLIGEQKKDMYTPQGKLSCIEQHIEAFDWKKKYHLSFIFDSLQRNPVSIYLKRETQKVAASSDVFIRPQDREFVFNSKYGLTHQTVFEGRDGDRAMSLYMCAQDIDAMRTHSRLWVTEHTTPTIGYIQPKQDVQSRVSPIELPYTHVNPTEYRFTKNTSAPQLVVLNESYNKKWHINKASDTGMRVFDGTSPQYTLNGYANAWMVNGDLGERFIISFIPQKWLYVGTVVSVVSLIVVLGIFLRRRVV